MKKIVNLFKDVFTATERNRKVPLVLHSRAGIIYLALVLILIAAPIYVKNTHLALLSAPVSFTPEQIISLINSSRANAGLNTLKENPKLIAAAEKKASDMITKSYFAHVSPEQKTPWQFLRAEEYRYMAAGENLALDFLTAESAHDAWMNSPTHKANILNKLYTETGVAIAQGSFQNRSSVFIVQFFGKPATTKTTSSKQTATPPKTITSVPTKTSTVATSPLGPGANISEKETKPTSTPTLTSTVLGFTTQAKDRIADQRWRNFIEVLGVEPVRIQLVSIFLIGTLIYGMASLLRESLNPPPRVILQGLVLILLLTYAASAPLKKIVTAEITSVPAHTFVLDVE